VNRRLGIWLSPDRWALVSFLYLKKRREREGGGGKGRRRVVREVAAGEF